MTIRHCSACNFRKAIPKKSKQTRCAYCGAMFTALTVDWVDSAPLCAYCQTVMTGRKRTYCNRDCQQAAWHLTRIRPERKTPMKKSGVCAYCNKAYICDGRLVAKIYCSNVCCGKAQQAKQRTTTDATNCVVCNKQLPARTTAALRIYCSKACYKKSPATRARYARKQGRHRAMKLKAFVSDVDRSAIYERDGWRCQICKLKVNPRYSGTHPKAPSLDHIIPLAVGGTHEPSNVQLAHFGCNARKSSRAANDQLLLIG